MWCIYMHELVTTVNKTTIKQTLSVSAKQHNQYTLATTNIPYIVSKFF